MRSGMGVGGRNYDDGCLVCTSDQLSLARLQLSLELCVQELHLSESLSNEVMAEDDGGACEEENGACHITTLHGRSEMEVVEGVEEVEAPVPAECANRFLS